jgi:hypothetical protein
MLAHLSHTIASFGLYFDDISAEVSKEACTSRARNGGTDFYYPQTCEWAS